MPPLNALRAFEAAARHLSFKHAAEELNVTPAAVGHQVRALEEQLGVRLFRRLNRSLMLTDAGQAGLPHLRDGFAKLAQGVSRMRAQDARGQLTVAVEPAFAAGWLVRRLSGFRAAHPETDILLDASSRVVDLAREDVDVAIRHGRGRDPGTHADLLMAESIYPVLSPDLLASGPPIETPADLARYTLLHDDADSEDASWPDWPTWFQAAGVAGVDAARGPRFSQTSLMMEAAYEGQGVALAGASIVVDSLREGWLVRPLGEEFETPLEFAYYVVSLESKAGWPRVAAFREWLLARAASER